MRQHHTRDAAATYDATDYKYTPAGKLEKLETPGDSEFFTGRPTWTYDYDIRGRQISADDPDRGITSTTYDILDRPQTVTDAEDRVLRTEYNEFGQKTALRDGTSPLGRTRASWEYHEAGPATGQVETSTRYVDTNADNINDDEYSTTYGYDTVGRPNDVTMQFPLKFEDGFFGIGGYRTQSTYYANGAVRSVQQPSTIGTGVTDENLTYTYDGIGNVKSIIGAGAIVADTIYTPDGLVTRRTLGPTIGKSKYDTRDYDNSTRRITRQTVSTQGSALTTHMALQYDYDSVGNITSLHDFAHGDSSGTSGDSFRQCFTYDYLQRMTGAWTPPNTDCAAGPGGFNQNLGSQSPYRETFRYDKLGNRFQQLELRGLHRAGRVGATNDLYYPTAAAVRPHAPEYLESIPFGSGATTRETYGYDDTGAMITRDKSHGLDQTITWDVEGRQTTVEERDGDNPTGNRTSYVYDADGNRILKKNRGQRRQHDPLRRQQRIHPQTGRARHQAGPQLLHRR